MNKCQPMETAPKDRSILLMIDGDWCEGWWTCSTTLKGKSRKDGSGRWEISFECESLEKPTGWCELPEVPDE